MSLLAPVYSYWYISLLIPVYHYLGLVAIRHKSAAYERGPCKEKVSARKHQLIDSNRGNCELLERCELYLY